MSLFTNFFKESDTQLGVFYPNHSLIAVFRNLETAQQALGGHLKTGQQWTPEKRPTQPSQDKSIYTAAEAVPANFLHEVSLKGFILARPGRRIRLRRDATGAPTQRPEWRGGASRPVWRNSGEKAVNPRGLGTESPSKTKHFDSETGTMELCCDWLRVHF